MFFKFNGSEYELLLKKKVIPIAIRPIINELHNTSLSYSPIYGGTKLLNKVALVTGGYKGIGICIVKTFLREGAKVVIVGRNKDKMKEVCSILNTNNVSCLEWDIASTEDAYKLMLSAGKFFGKIDILINNAGVTSMGPTRQKFNYITENDFRYIHDINVIGTRNMCKVFADYNNNGSILNIISNTGVYAAKDSYSMSKWAIYSFTKTFGNECHKENKAVNVNGICPGPIRTDMSFKKGDNMYRREIPNHRIGLPEEIAELSLMVVYSSFHGLNGQVFISDGGEILM